TKKDLVEDEEWLELVLAEVTDELEGTCLAEAPIILVSAKTGEGLSALVRELDLFLAKTEARRDLGRPRLPVDRVFTISGFGTVVTGTLSDGRFQVGQEVEILPQGLKARIRGLQTHKEKIDVAVPGSRVAINLTGVSPDELRRGDVVTLPGWLIPTKLIDVRLRQLASAPAPLKHNALVDFFSGSSEIQATVRLLDHEILPPGAEGWVQLRLAKPAILLKNDRFIIRQPSPSLTIGGGTVVNVHPRHRHRRFQREVLAELETMAYGTPEEILLQTLTSRQPREARQLIKDCGLPDEAAVEALRTLLTDGRILVLGDQAPEIQEIPTQHLISAVGWRDLSKHLSAILRDYHQRYRLRKGIPREELKSRLRQRVRPLSTKIFNGIIVKAAGEGWLIEEEGTIRLSDHAVVFSPAEQHQIDELMAAFRRNPYATPSVAESEAVVGPAVLNALLEQGQMIRVSDDVIFLTETYEEMVERVIANIREKGSITVAQVRDMFGASRKYALALMEHLDERKMTKRVGDERVLR
ncbi:MAG: SelB C-terminal domain-containing protein, partial [Anaerolineae bacterium]